MRWKKRDGRETGPVEREKRMKEGDLRPLSLRDGGNEAGLAAL